MKVELLREIRKERAELTTPHQPGTRAHSLQLKFDAIAAIANSEQYDDTGVERDAMIRAVTLLLIWLEQ